ncbi:MAG TPA: OsmC family protein [Marinagarivorans sp.]
MTIRKKGSAAWQGSIKAGSGTVSTESGALNEQPYGFNTRFEDKAGTNPEELIAAAHASCYSMALSLGLGDANYTARTIRTEATVNLDKDGDGFAVTAVHLKVTADVPEISESEFLDIAETTKGACPISKLLNAEITLEATLLH